MPKFSAIVEGDRARERGIECTTLGGTPFTVDLRLLDGAEEDAVIKYATAQCKEAGVDAVETSLIWQYHCAIYEVFLACVDPDSPLDSPVQFFDTVAQVRKNLDRERILLLGETQRRFQTRSSPRVHELSEAKITETIMAAAAVEEGGVLPFERWPRLTLESFTRSTCVRLCASLMAKSGTGSGTAATASG